MQLRPRALVLVLVLVGSPAFGGCAGTDKGSEPAATEPEAGAGIEGGEGAGPAPVGTESVVGANKLSELPPELLGDLRLQGADADGRLLTIGSGFIATAECSTCGAPSYLRLLAVRCADTRHCEILTAQCEGKISRDEQLFAVELHPVEDGAADLCAGYSGTFELP